MANVNNLKMYIKSLVSSKILPRKVAKVVFGILFLICEEVEDEFSEWWRATIERSQNKEL